MTSGSIETGLVVAGETATQVYSGLLRTLLAEGEQVKPRGVSSRELRPVVTRIYQPDRRWVGQPTRRLVPALGVLEGLQLVGGFSCPAALVRVAPQYAKFINPGNGRLDGGYGPRLGLQLPYVLRLLRQDPDSRQAVVTVFGERDQRTSLDVPCTVSLQFFVRFGMLELLVNMRSNDAWLGWPYDVVQFSMLQAAVAADLDLKVGTYTHVSGSMHLYERNVEAAEQVAEDERDEAELPPAMAVQPLAKSMLEARAAVKLWWQVAQGSTPDVWAMPTLSDADYVQTIFFKWCLNTLRKQSGLEPE